jgi:Helix-turn-helix domain
MNDEKIQEAPTELKAFLSEKEMLQRLPISRRTLFNWRTSGKIPAVKIGRRCLYHFPSIEAALLRLQRGGVE